MKTTLIDSHIHFSASHRLPELKRYCRAVEAEKVCVLSLPTKERINFNPEVLLAKALLGDRCYGLGSFDFSEVLHPEPSTALDASAFRDSTARLSTAGQEGPDLAGQVRVLRHLGFDGLKVFAGKPSFQARLGLKLSDPVFVSAFKEAERSDLTTLIHIADPPVFWSSDGMSGFDRPLWAGSNGIPEEANPLPGYEELQSQALAVLEACPDLPVIFPHLLMMAHDLSRLAHVLETHGNAYLDLAPGLYFYGELAVDRPAAREFFRTYRDRILFGSDGFWFAEHFTGLPYARYSENLHRSEFLLRFLETEEEMDNPFELTRRIRPRLRGLGLDRAILDVIYRDNFLRLYGESPRELNPLAGLEYVHSFINRLDALGTNPTGRRAVEALYGELETTLGETV
jgi:predicted TIM-barrel fold metal-dependent hydrolase